MRVVVADDSLLTRAGIVAILREVGCEVVGEARDGVEAVTTVRVRSIKAGLEASTVTPGSTAPDVSLTIPAMPLCA